jgi:hypothetical protein
MKTNVLNFDEECWGPQAEKISIWHFDPTIVDKPEDVFTQVCNFDYDFSKDIEQAKENLLPTTTYDVEFWQGLGYPKIQATDSTNKLPLNDYPTFKKVIDDLGLIEDPNYDIKVKLFRQLPGQILPSHIDNYKKANEKTTSGHALKAVRFAVALNDWNVGHYWHFGNTVWSQWKTGDCVHWHRTMAHGTANVGHTERLTLQITGIPSQKTLSLINSVV